MNTEELRSRIRKHFVRLGAEIAGDIVPGHPEYLRLAKHFVPLEVPLGKVRSDGCSLSWLPGLESNGTFLVIGASGSGKTETLKFIGNSIVESAFPVFVLDFHGDVIFPGQTSHLLSSGTASILGVNPMEIDFHGDDQVGLYEQRIALVESVQRAVPNLGHRQKMILLDAVSEAYRRCGIRDACPETWRNQPPTFPDVLNILDEWLQDDNQKSKHRSIPSCIDAIRCVFDHPIFRRSHFLTLEDILQRNIRVDISKLSAGMCYIVADALLRKVFRALKLRGYKPVRPVDDTEMFRLFVIIDETKILSMGNGDINSQDHILNILATEGRKFGIGLILASQMVDHFGNAVSASASTRLVMQTMDAAEAKKNASNVQVTGRELMDLSGKGDGYFRSRIHPERKLIQVAMLPVS